MEKIYKYIVTESQFKKFLLTEYKSEKVTLYEFYNELKKFVEEFIVDPKKTKITPFLKKNYPGIDTSILRKLLIDKDIIKKEIKAHDSVLEKSTIKYSLPKKDFYNKTKRLFNDLEKEKEEVSENTSYPYNTNIEFDKKIYIARNKKDTPLSQGAVDNVVKYNKINETKIGEKNVDSEFEKIKNSYFSSLREYPFIEIVNNWGVVKNIKNDNIETIKYFIENPNKIDLITFDKNGLADGFHRLIAMKILGIKTLKYKYVDEYLGESARMNESIDFTKKEIYDAFDSISDINGNPITFSVSEFFAALTGHEMYNTLVSHYFSSNKRIKNKIIRFRISDHVSDSNNLESDEFLISIVCNSGYSEGVTYSTNTIEIFINLTKNNLEDKLLELVELIADLPINDKIIESAINKIHSVNKLISEELTRTDVKEILDQQLKSGELLNQIKKEVTTQIGKSKDLENKIVEISSNVIVQLYKSLWTKRGFWKSDLKNSAS